MAGDDEKVKKITALLERGGTMLAQHHACGAPLFKYGGRVVCPVCDDPLGGGQEGKAAREVPGPAAAATPIGGGQASELRALLLGHACRASRRLTGGEDPDADTRLLAGIEAALRCAAMLRDGK